MSAEAAITAAGACAGVGIVTCVVGEFLGLPVQPVVWAMLGGAFGMIWARRYGRVMAVLAYIAGSLLSALFGNTTAEWMGLWFSLTDKSTLKLANAFSALMSIGFHVALDAFVARVPFLTNFAIDRAIAVIPKRGGKP